MEVAAAAKVAAACGSCLPYASRLLWHRERVQSSRRRDVARVADAPAPLRACEEGKGGSGVRPTAGAGLTHAVRQGREGGGGGERA
eukprot:1454358-Pleurochrysis_carterae.AAC.2